MELLHSLGINWAMLIAQMINFAILLIALTYLLYRPILRLLDERRDRVRRSMDDAKKLEQNVKEMEEQRRKRLQEMDKEAKTFLQQAKDQADAAKQEILADAKKEVEQLLDRGRKQMEDERAKMLSSIEQTVTGLSVRLAQKILEREFTPKDQERLVGSLQKDLPSLLR